MPLDEITTGTCLDYIAARRAENDGIASSTLLNDLTAWSRVMSHAFVRQMASSNPLLAFPRSDYLGADGEPLNPPTDAELADMVSQVSNWSPEVGTLMVWLRETGMRLNEALQIHRADIHPCGTRATLRRGVKGNKKSGLKTREIALGRAAALLPDLRTKGRLFADLHDDPAVVSTRYGQWCRQRQAREDRLSGAEGREPTILRRFRLHDIRHAFAMASVVDHPNRLGELKEHMGHSSQATTEGYTKHLKGEGSQWRYGRDPDRFGSLPVA